jgi:hypothetical protein
MPSRISLSGNFAGNSIGNIPPIYSGVALWTFFGNGSADNVNLVPGSAALAPVSGGAPAAYSGFARFTSNVSQASAKGYATGISDVVGNVPMTVIVAARAVTSAVVSMIGSYKQPSGGGNSGWDFSLNTNVVGNADVHSYITGYTDGGGTSGGAQGLNDIAQGQVVGGTTTWHLYAFRVPAIGSPIKVNDLTDGIQVQSTANVTAANYAPASPADQIYLGTDGATVLAGGQVDLAFAGLILGNALSDGQLTALVSPLRSILAQRGVVV